VGLATSLSIRLLLFGLVAPSEEGYKVWHRFVDVFIFIVVEINEASKKYIKIKDDN